MCVYGCNIALEWERIFSFQVARLSTVCFFDFGQRTLFALVCNLFIERNSADLQTGA